MSGRRTHSTARRLGAGLAAAAVVSLALPVTLGGAGASAAPSAPTGASTVRTAGDPEFAGYAATAISTPVRIEVYEPTIPLPASPQGELNFGYAVVKADSSTSRGKASYLWPGDAVGEGFKTIAEQVLTPFGFPPEVTDPIYEAGYPIQVNSNHPAGPPSESDEQVPGSIQRTSASAEKTTALSGYSTDCKLGQEQPAEEGDGEGEEGPIPGLPDLPFPGLDGLTKGLTAVLAPAAKGPKAAAAEEEEVACPLPAELTTIIDIGGFGAQSTVTRGEDEDGIERVKAVSRSAVGEISLLLGIVQIDGLVATATTTSDGAKATTVGVTDYGTLTIAGQKFRYGSDGFEAAGTPQDIPGLPADPNQALEALGVQVLLPQPTEQREGDKGTTAVGGLQIVIDSTKVRQQLIDGGLPIGAISEAINGLPFPEEAGQVKSVLGAALNLSPKFVITLGNATSVVDTSPEIVIPEVDTGDTETDGGGGGTPTGGGTGTGGVATPGGDVPLDAGAPADSGSEPAIGDDTLTDAAPAGAGLPELFSIPGALFFGGILGAALLGSYLRRLGILALGGGSNCSMGLEAGLPDLRKA